MSVADSKGNLYVKGTELLTGRATAGGTATLTDSSLALATNVLANGFIRITGGTGAGQFFPITSNTATVITVGSNWGTVPDNTSTYAVYL